MYVPVVLLVLTLHRKIKSVVSNWLSEDMLQSLWSGTYSCVMHDGGINRRLQQAMLCAWYASYDHTMFSSTCALVRLITRTFVSQE